MSSNPVTLKLGDDRCYGLAAMMPMIMQMVQQMQQQQQQQGCDGAQGGQCGQATLSRRPGGETDPAQMFAADHAADDEAADPPHPRD